MLARIWSASLVGIDAIKVGVEVDVAGGLPGIVVVGLPDIAVQESRERVKAALKNAGYAVPMRKIVIFLVNNTHQAVNCASCLSPRLDPLPRDAVSQS